MATPRTRRGLVPATAPPLDEIFAVNGAYVADTDATKVNLSVGVYRTNDGQPWPLPTIEAVEHEGQAKPSPFRHEYLTIQGDVAFLGLARDLAFDVDEEDAAEKQAAQPADDAVPDTATHVREQPGRIVSVQTVSGTGANHMGAKYLAAYVQPGHVWLPAPTWANHYAIWELEGLEARMYPYFDPVTRGVDFAGMLQALEQADEGDVVLLHACAHNPTGADPTPQQWRQVADLCERRKLVPFFDLAYQGFASGDVATDAWAVRHFYGRPQLEFLLAQSFSKNFGLYGQRAGALHIVLRADADPTAHGVVLANACQLIRGEYSMAPRAGSDLVRSVLQVPALRRQWKADLVTMSGRIKAMRKALYEELVRLGTPGSWVHIVNQIGMFSYTGLTEAQVAAVRTKYHVYLISSGRISISGLTTENVAHVAKAFDDVVRTVN
ncbi:aspartate aminotransferase [Grosmannia clavigera kw1407]|uniref:Aspartate aminotransferase n=1 Tax=Grosmannia clavigera (strain kw1407 / UAMH 11150) TaxID=655863 RepID=F0X7P8_GROCL|nr:aspartate aminotransferase [Grosmannia clavigera kw1407]EFX06679.1 aspartate aminotransferase [Grosmannia clavigera kw1407]